MRRPKEGMILAGGNILIWISSIIVYSWLRAHLSPSTIYYIWSPSGSWILLLFALIAIVIPLAVEIAWDRIASRVLGGARKGRCKIKRMIFLVLMLSFLCSCASDYAWKHLERDPIDLKEVNRDTAFCKFEANKYLGPMPAYGPGLAGALMMSGHLNRQTKLFEQCMEAKGYYKESLPQTWEPAAAQKP